MRHSFITALLIKCGFSPASANAVSLAMIEGGRYGAHEYLKVVGTPFLSFEEVEAEVCV